MVKLFYSTPKWLAFVAPEKPERPTDTFCMTFYMIDMRNYDEACSEAKRNAMEIGNPEIIISNTPLGGFEIQFIDGVGCSTWPGDSEIKDGKIFLTI